MEASEEKERNPKLLDVANETLRRQSERLNLALILIRSLDDRIISRGSGVEELTWPGWTTGRDLIRSTYYDIASGKGTHIANQKSVKLSPVISGDKMVWIDDRNQYW